MANQVFSLVIALVRFRVLSHPVCQVRNQVRNQVCSQVYARAVNQVHNLALDQAPNQAGNLLDDPPRNPRRSQVCNHHRDPVHGQLLSLPCNRAPFLLPNQVFYRLHCPVRFPPGVQPLFQALNQALHQPLNHLCLQVSSPVFSLLLDQLPNRVYNHRRVPAASPLNHQPDSLLVNLRCSHRHSLVANLV